MKTSLESAAPSFLFRLALIFGMICLWATSANAGGPKYVAGTSFFDPTTTGQPLVWPQGVITYYTDQGDLSPILPNASANSFVASAFSQWTAVPTAAITAASGGQLAEDVNGTNVIVNSDATISMPADIQPTATGTPIGIVYDYDGSVTDALIGTGAGGSSECFSNAVFGGADSYGTFATIQHALIVINGQCALQSSQLTDVEYRLLRVIGGVLGVGWSQVNPNVLTAHATADDYAGFPLMHPTDPRRCVPITLCYPSPLAVTMDDGASLSRLYPVTTQNQSNFAGKQVFAATTARIHGSVWFTDSHGNRTQAMQGVNVVARWIDPSTGLPSRRYAASSVSGFLFTGDAGNPITGFNDSMGNPLADWGSSSLTEEGFFDLAGLQPPNGNSAQYQLTVEAIDPLWSQGVGPYSPGPVTPSGVVQPILVTATPGNDVQQDILMAGSEQPLIPPQSSWTKPEPVPQSGDWVASLSGYGVMEYFLLPAQANRTLSVAVTAMDESGSSTEFKAEPVIGMWAASDPQGTSPPAFTPSAFNQLISGMTRLDAQVATSTNFLIGISDVRGDGRPDYHYHAHILYADSVSPSRVGVNGGPITVHGTGFMPGLTAAMGASSVAKLATSAGQVTLVLPPHGDGPQSVTISDPVSGSSSTMTNAIMFGAAASDNIVLVRGLNPSTAVGAQATYPVIVRVLAADGVTAVSGATIGWTANNGVQLSACGGASSCSVATDQNGNATTWLTPATAGVATITATVAPGVYSPAKSVSAQLSATESAADIGISTPYLWISQGATASLPLTARVLSNGVPQSNVKVNFSVASGAATLSAASAQTSSTGYATVTLTVSKFAATVQVNACVAPNNVPCVNVYANPVPLAQQVLQAVSGSGQITNTTTFQPIIVRVTDSSSPPNPVSAAAVTFLTTVFRPGGESSGGNVSDTNSGDPAMPVILKVTQANATTDANGMANVVPSGGGFSAPVDVDVKAMAASGAFLDYPLQVLPSTAGGNGSEPTMPIEISRPPDLPR